jgi:hypothetical protein
MADESEGMGPMSEPRWLAEQFEESRGHLRGVAYRMLGSLSEALRPIRRPKLFWVAIPSIGLVIWLILSTARGGSG